MAHEHSHEDDSYYLDQLCMVALSGAFGAVCLALYFWNTEMLTRLLGQQFHLFVLISGITLVTLAILRSISLWAQVGRQKPDLHDHEHHAHTHEHGEHEHGEHGHVHAADGHDHGHGHGGHTHADHSHADHSHADHSHADHTHVEHAHADHGHEDHDHGWAPWRYVVLMVPIMLFLLGLPNKGPKAMAIQSEGFAAADAAAEAAGLISPGLPGWSQLGFLGVLGKDEASGDIEDRDFRSLSEAVSQAASSPDPNVREAWKNKQVRVIGMYAPNSEHEFHLVRFKLTCCVADAIQSEPADNLAGKHLDHKTQHLGARHRTGGVPSTTG